MESLHEKSVLVTGGAGFIGSHLCDKLLLFGPSRLSIVDDFSLGKERNIDDIVDDARVIVHRSDASDINKMRRIMREDETDIVFNLAVVPLPRSLLEPKDTIDKNVMITSTVCELARQRVYRTLIHCSSSEVYGSARRMPMDEDHPEKPITPYAASKIACDQVVISYHKTFGIDMAIARPFNAYGPRQNEGNYAGVIPATINRILDREAPIITGDGLQSRDYTYVGDTVEGIVRTYLHPVTRGLTLNIASGVEIQIGRLIRTIARLMGYTGKITHDPPRPGDVRRHRADISLARTLIGFGATTEFDEGLRLTIDWYAEVRRKK